VIFTSLLSQGFIEQPIVNKSCCYSRSSLQRFLVNIITIISGLTRSLPEAQAAIELGSVEVVAPLTTFKRLLSRLAYKFYLWVSDLCSRIHKSFFGMIFECRVFVKGGSNLYT